MEAIWQALQSLGSRDMAEFGLLPLLMVLLVSLASSIFIAYLYQVFYCARATGSAVYRAFPLMGISITAIFISVQFSLPLSLGLLGALSIVRFRTPIKEPEEIGFILLVIATSLSAATFNLAFLGLLLAVAVLALLLVRTRIPFLSARAADGMVMVVLPASSAAQVDAVLAVLRKELPKGNIDSVSEGTSEVTISYRFRQLDPSHVADLHADLKGAANGARPTVFFHQAGDV